MTTVPRPDWHPSLFGSPPRAQEPAGPRSDGDDAGDPPLSVTEFSELVKGLLEETFPFLSVWGEVSNLARPRSGHIYFTLKDAESQVACTLWKSLASRLRFELEDGM